MRERVWGGRAREREREKGSRERERETESRIVSETQGERRPVWHPRARRSTGRRMAVGPSSSGAGSPGLALATCASCRARRKEAAGVYLCVLPLLIPPFHVRTDTGPPSPSPPRPPPPPPQPGSAPHFRTARGGASLIGRCKGARARAPSGTISLDITASVVNAAVALHREMRAGAKGDGQCEEQRTQSSSWRLSTEGAHSRDV